MSPEVAVAIINGVFLVIVTYVAKQNHDIHQAAKVNTAAIARVEHQTNGELDSKIRGAVMEVFRDHRAEVTEAVMAESVRHLLDALVNGKDGPGGWS